MKLSLQFNYYKNIPENVKLRNIHFSEGEKEIGMYLDFK